MFAPPSATPDMSLSPGVVRRLQHWLESCRENHDRCRKRFRDSNHRGLFYPSRLVYVGTSNNDSVRLIDTAEVAPTGPYMTLSHRWPEDASRYTQLREDNLGFLKIQIETKSLSRTFQDAINCTWSLGVKYLWIDSLCILQDSKADWETESATMADIYSHSYCNISATADECKEHGLFHPKRPMRSGHARVRARWIGHPPGAVQDQPAAQPQASSSHGEEYVLFDREFWAKRVDKQELFSRGWVFQEQQLARRIIHFGPDQLLWECRQQRACETYPSGLPQVEMGWGEQLKGDFQVATLVKGALAQPTLPGFYPSWHLSPWVAWQKIVEVYSGLNLTKGEDRLVAIAGVAQTYRDLYSGHYVAGHWDEALLPSLIWSIPPNSHAQSCPLAKVQRPEWSRKPAYLAPSWSWASVDGPVSVLGYETALEARHAVEIVRASAICSGNGPFGLITGGDIVFRGNVYPASFVRDKLHSVSLLVDGGENPAWEVDVDLCCERHPESRQYMGDEYDAASDDEQDREIDEDIRGDDEESDDESDECWDAESLSSRFPHVFFLPLLECTVRDGTGCARAGLVLEAVEGERGVYKRIGRCCHTGDATDAEPKPRRGWGLPRPGIFEDVEGVKTSSQLYLGEGDRLVKLI